MRILYCNKYDYPFSGTETYLFDLMHRMEGRGYETALFSMEHGHSPAFAGRSYRIPHIDFKDPHASLLKKVRMAAHALYSPSAGGPCAVAWLIFHPIWHTFAESITTCPPRFSGN